MKKEHKLLNIETIKEPCFENDDFLIKFYNFYIQPIVLDNIIEDYNDYLRFKCEMFRTCYYNNDLWLDFLKENDIEKQRPALRNINNTKKLDGSIYTVTASKRNSSKLNLFEKICKDERSSYSDLINIIKTAVEKYVYSDKKSRRIFLRFSNNIHEYIDSEEKDITIDTTCLVGIHYLKYGFKLIFRASDIKNELLPDIISIYKYFIIPVYKDVENYLNMTIYASTAQNINNYKMFIDEAEELFWNANDVSQK